MKKTYFWLSLLTFVSLFCLVSGTIYAASSTVEVTGQVGVRTVSSTEPEEPPVEETTVTEETSASEETSSEEASSADSSSDERELANISQNLPQTNAMTNPWIAVAGGVLLLTVFGWFIWKQVKAGKAAE